MRETKVQRLERCLSITQMAHNEALEEWSHIRNAFRAVERLLVKANGRVARAEDAVQRAKAKLKKAQEAGDV